MSDLTSNPYADLIPKSESTPSGSPATNPYADLIPKANPAASPLALAGANISQVVGSIQNPQPQAIRPRIVNITGPKPKVMQAGTPVSQLPKAAPLPVQQQGPSSGGPGPYDNIGAPLTPAERAASGQSASLSDQQALLNDLANSPTPAIDPTKPNANLPNAAAFLNDLATRLDPVAIAIHNTAIHGNPVAKAVSGVQQGLLDLVNPAGAVQFATGALSDPLATIRGIGEAGARAILPSTVTEQHVTNTKFGPIITESPDITGYTRNLVGLTAGALAGTEAIGRLRAMLPEGIIPTAGPLGRAVPIEESQPTVSEPSAQQTQPATHEPVPHPNEPLTPHQQWAQDNWRLFAQRDLNDINDQLSQLSGADKQTSRQLGSVLRPIRNHLEAILQNDTPPDELLQELTQKRKLAVDAQNGALTEPIVTQAAETLGIQPNEVKAAILHYSEGASDTPAEPAAATVAAGDTGRGEVTNAGARENARPEVANSGVVPGESASATVPEAVHSAPTEPVTATEVEPGRLTGIRNADTDAARLARGLPESEKASPITFAGELARGKDAVGSGRIDPVALADAINTRPRTLSTEEQAAIGYHITQLESQDAALIKEAAQSNDPQRLAQIGEQRKGLESQWDSATKALKASGSRIGQALGFRRVQFGEDFSPIGIKGRAAAAKGAPLTAEESFRADSLAGKLKAAQDRISELEAQAANKKVAGIARARGYTRESLAAERTTILSDMAKLTSKVSANPIDAIPGGLDLLRKLAVNVAREGFLTLDDLLARVREHLKPLGVEISKKHLIDALNSHKESPEPSEATKNVAEMRRQAFLQKSIDATQKAIDTGEYKDAAAKKGVPASEELARLQSRAKDLNAQHEALKESARIHGEVKAGTYKEPPKKVAPEVSPELQEARDKLARARSEARAFIADQKPVSAISVAGEIPRAAILANPTIAGHIMMAGPGTLIAAELARLPASVRNFANSALYKATGGKLGTNQTVRQGFSLPDFSQAVAKGVTQGVKEIPGYFTHGENSIQSALRVKPDEYYGQHGLSSTFERLKEMKANKSARTAQNLLKTGRDILHSVGLVHGAIQQPFAMIPGLKRSILEQAHIAATNLPEPELKALDPSLSNLSGSRLRASAKKFLAANPTDAMLQGGIEEGLRTSMMQDNALYSAVKSFRNTLDRSGKAGQVGNAVLTSVMPVLKPATNAAFTAAEYTPLGVTRGVGGYAKAALEGSLSKLTPQDRASLQQMMDRGLTGTAILALGAYLYNQGAVKGSFRYPNDMAAYKSGKSDTEAMNMNLGAKGLGLESPSSPGTIEVGGFGIPLHKMGALGSIIQLGADLQRASQESEGHSLAHHAAGQESAAFQNLNPAKPLIDAGERIARDFAVPGKKAQ